MTILIFTFSLNLGYYNWHGGCIITSMTLEQYQEAKKALQRLDHALDARWSAEFAERTWKYEVDQSTEMGLEALMNLCSQWFEMREKVKV